MNDPKLFSKKSLLVWLMAAVFAVGLVALPAQAEDSKVTLKFNMQACSKPGSVTVELRNKTSPYALVESGDGTGGGNVAAVISFGKAADGVSYYVVVKSVNSLETWSATTVTFNSNAASYDFTTATSQAYGGNQTQSNNLPSIYQGDVNQDGVIELNDILAVYNDATSFVTGKPSTDFNCDGVTDLTDQLLPYNNSQNFVSVKKPQ